MFSIGFGEFAVICIVLIIAVGPERLPSMMKTVGKTMRTLRQASRDIRTATGIDELMRDEDLYAQPKAKRPLPALADLGPAPVSRADVPAALPAPADAAPDASGGQAQAQDAKAQASEPAPVPAAVAALAAPAKTEPTDVN